MAATEGGDPVPVAKVSIGPRAEPPGTCTQAAALVAKDVRTALRSPVACIASTLAPALLVFLMGITGLIQDDATPPAQATSFAAAAADPGLLSFLFAPVYPPARDISRPPLAWGQNAPPRLVVGPASDPCANRLVNVLNNDTSSLPAYAAGAASWPRIAELAGNASAAMSASPGVYFAGVTLTSSPASASTASSCDQLPSPGSPGSLGSRWDYAIHVNGSFAPLTDPKSLRVSQGDPAGSQADHAGRDDFRTWETSGVLAVQAWVDSAVLRLHGVPAVAAPATAGAGGPPAPARALRLPLPKDNAEPTSSIEKLFSPLMPLFALSIFLGTFATRLVKERSQGMRQSLALMGMRGSAYWTSTFGWTSLQCAAAVALVVAAQVANRTLEHSNAGLVFCVELVYLLAGMAFTAALSSSLGAPDRAATVVGMVPIATIIIWAPVSLFADSIVALKLVLAALLPHFGLMASFGRVLVLENDRRGLVPSTMLEGGGDVSVLAVVGLMALSGLLWGALAVCVDSRRFSPSVARLHGSAAPASGSEPVASDTVEAFDPEAVLGVHESKCVHVTGLTKVFPGVANTSRDCVEAHNDIIEARRLGLAAAPDGDAAHGAAAGGAPERGTSKGAFDPRKDLLAVAGVSFTLAPGQVVCLLGANGGGKSTTINMITGTLAATRGGARFFGEDLSPDTVHRVRASTGVCPQHNVNWPELSAREHLTLFGTLRGLGPALERQGRSLSEEVRRRLEQVELLGDDADRPVAAFSGGMRRKLALAAAMLGSPPVLLLDEPTSGCDPLTRRHMWDLILAERERGACVVFTTHELSEAEFLADRVLVIKRGRLVAGGGKLFLKQRFTEGYELGATFSGPEQAAAGRKALEAAAGGAHVAWKEEGEEDAEGGEGPGAAAESGRAEVQCTASLPWAAQGAVASCLEALDAAGGRHATVQQATLESVFLAITNKAEEPADGLTRAQVEERAAAEAEANAEAAKGKARTPTKAGAAAGGAAHASAAAVPTTASPLASRTAGRSLPTAAATPARAKAVVPLRAAELHVCMQTRSIMWRQLQSAVREPAAVFWAMIFPLGYIVAALIVISQLSGDGTTAVPPLPLSGEVVRGGHGIGVVGPAGSAAVLLAEQAACALLGHSPPAIAAGGAASLAVLANANQSFPPLAGCGQVATSEDGATSSMVSNATVAFNSSVPTAKAALASALSTAALRLGLADPAAGVSATLAPLPDRTPNLLIGFLASMFLGVSATNFVMTGAFEMANDREIGTRVKMRVSGLKHYFLALFSFDMVYALTPLMVATIVALALGTPVLGDSRAGGFVCATLLFVPAGAMQAYLVSTLFVRSLETAGPIIPMFMTFSGLLPHLVAQSLETTSSLDAGRSLRRGLAFIPTFNYYSGLNSLALLTFTDPPGEGQPFSQEAVFGMENGVGYHLAWAAGQIVLEASALWLLENWEWVGATLCRRHEGSRSAAGASPASGAAKVVAAPAPALEGELAGASSQPRAAAASGAAVRAADRDEEERSLSDIQSERIRAVELSKTPGAMAAVSLTRDVPSGAAGGGTTRILEDWSLGVRRGEVVALLGPAGAGKTTAMRVLTGESLASNASDPDGLSGRVFLDGIVREARPGFTGYCPQQDSLWPDLSVDAHLHLFAGLRGVPAAEREPLFAALCDSLDLTRHRTKAVKQLSGGNKRKLGLATAVLGLPGAIISDEPSTGVDAGARRSIWAVVDAARAGAAQLVSTHSMDEAARIGDRVAIMAEGRLRAVGTAEELKDAFGSGILVDVETSGPAASARVVDALARPDGPLPGTVVRDQVGAVVKLRVPFRARAGRSRAVEIARVFRAMDTLKSGDDGLRLFSVTEPTLDDVFMAVVTSAASS
ncbi:hypothetical protein FNF29_06454 [Cafeteria roenbergensis]|uniref:ABC transporter domain-containing protein n=1 Tax=Cafeteria roenbergensis TaxID=33653 RepID=A0A5A8C9A1_CAFRO|nr:hypothetical protein FNF29_06454 [Cafeteria roenbergensis]KAA0149475.1 hypothetical protein FNF31_07213 [Cafeteria roenbergensis]|eukprot:KAA0148829.1 hypothetical protein FNF29_06454 [Cafeteria roenbergensis]